MAKIPCPDCGETMYMVVQIETGNSDSGCCPSRITIYQCPKCKTITSD